MREISESRASGIMSVQDAGACLGTESGAECARWKAWENDKAHRGRCGRMTKRSEQDVSA